MKDNILHRSVFQKNFRTTLPLLLMCIPGAAILFILNYLPLHGLQLAFKKWNAVDGIWHSPFVGLRNFEFFIKSIYFPRITINTLGYNLVFIVSLLFSSLLIAILLNEVKNRIQIKYLQTTMIFAQFLSWVVVGYMAYAFLSPSYGLLNKVLTSFGAETINWYADYRYWPFILVFFYTWKHMGYYALIYYAGIITIDKGYYEAAKIDGATKYQMMRNITLPLLKPQIIIVVLIQVGRIFYSDFGLFFNVTRNVGMLLPATDVMDYYVFRTLRENQNIDLAAAASFYQSIMGFTLVFITNKIIKKTSPENSIF